jgi:hypothetical protein
MDLILMQPFPQWNEGYAFENSTFLRNLATQRIATQTATPKLG